MLRTQLLLFFLAAPSAQASQVSPVDCENTAHSQQTHQCARLDRKQTHQAFNKAFNALNSRVRRQSQDNSELKEELLEQVERAQRLWSTSLKADCTLESFAIEPGTRAYQATFDSCLAQQYRLRETYLNGLMID